MNNCGKRTHNLSNFFSFTVAYLLLICQPHMREMPLTFIMFVTSKKHSCICHFQLVL